jgi:hypothetical protein
MRRFVPALLSLVISSAFCAAQTTVVDVKDESPVNCSVRMSGTITLTEWEENGEEKTSYMSQVSTTNLASQPIIAMVTFTTIANSVGPLDGNNHLLDAFFAHDLEIAPGQIATHEHDDNGVSSQPVPLVKHAPAATSRVVFVQYVDGSTCGDPNDGRVESLMRTRVDILLALKRIDNAAKIGDAQFLAALADKSPRTDNAEGILQNIRDMQKEKGSAAAIKYIRSMLDVAASR